MMSVELRASGYHNDIIVFLFVVGLHRLMGSGVQASTNLATFFFVTGGHVAVVLQDMGQFMSGAVAFQWSMVVISAFLMVKQLN